MENLKAQVDALTQQPTSTTSAREIERYKWTRKKAGRDFGEDAMRRWVKDIGGAIFVLAGLNTFRQRFWKELYRGDSDSCKTASTITHFF